jgi:hypothetical protein
MKKWVIAAATLIGMTGIGYGIYRYTRSKPKDVQPEETTREFDINQVDHSDGDTALAQITQYLSDYESTDLRRLFSNLNEDLYVPWVTDQQSFRLNYVRQCVVILMYMIAAENRGDKFAYYDSGIKVTLDVINSGVEDALKAHPILITRKVGDSMDRIVKTVIGSRILTAQAS